MNSNALKDSEILRKRLLFRSHHRGCKETDILLGRFADKWLNTFNDEELAQFEAILNEDDVPIYNWLTGQEALPQQHDNRVMKLLLEFDFTAA